MKKAYFKYILSLLLFGSNGVVVSGVGLSSFQIVFFRTLFGSLLLITVLLASRQKPAFLHDRRSLLFLALSGAAMGAGGIFLFEAYRELGVGVASLLYYCGPVIVMALSPFLFRERLTGAKLAGFALVLCGVVFVSGQRAAREGSARGVLFGVLSAVMYAAMVICNKKAKGITGIENATLQLFFSFLTVAVCTGLKQSFAISVSSADWLPLLVLGFVNTGVGGWLYFSALGELPVQTVSVCGYLEPLSAVVLSSLFLHESLRPVQLFGAALILGGAIFGECASRKSRAPLPENTGA